MLEVASLLHQSTVDAIETSGGNHVTGVFGEFFPCEKGKPKNNDDTPYYLDEAKRFKAKKFTCLSAARRRIRTPGMGREDSIRGYCRLYLPLQAPNTGAWAYQKMGVRGYGKVYLYIG